MEQKNLFIYIIIPAISCFIFIPTHSVFNKINHYKQISSDNHSTVLYSLNCESPKNARNCTLNSLIVAGDRAKHSCSVTFQTIFKKKTLKKRKDQKYSIEVARKKCADSITFIFDNNSISTFIKEFPDTIRYTGNNICEDLKVFNKEGLKITDSNMTRTEFQECKSMIVQIYDQ
ncbi:hypothetical protein ACWNT8_10480 [Pigmentibacter ruber]|uniref:hypothetical protein n=1 Tax=Pigmentibacter ruber TaxID=2683196 RepID=UPI00131E4890|nr:hypothetical protein [Pigmentibacter ruber]BFD32283.1 hypothetical protein GTC16762_19010 [Pigmentibacter ruber]